MNKYTQKCCGCQQEYTTKWRPRNNVWYCSKSCANKFNPRRKMEGVCYRCKGTISASRKYCSPCLQIVRDENKITAKARQKVYLRTAVKSYVRRIKEQAVQYKGGHCQLCGYKKYVGSMHFHHVDETLKSFQISGKSISFERIKVELDKCVLVCANCHGEIHGGLIERSVLEELVRRVGVEPTPMPD